MGLWEAHNPFGSDVMTVVCINAFPGMSDEALRAEARKLPNGMYVCQICRRCGLVLFREDGDLETCSIISCCHLCFDDDEDYQ